MQLEWKEESFRLRIPVQAFKPESITITATEFMRREALSSSNPALNRDLAA